MLLPEKCSCGRSSQTFKELDLDAHQLKELTGSDTKDIYTSVWECPNCQRQYQISIEPEED